MAGTVEDLHLEEVRSHRLAEDCDALFHGGDRVVGVADGQLMSGPAAWHRVIVAADAELGSIERLSLMGRAGIEPATLGLKVLSDRLRRTARR